MKVKKIFINIILAALFMLSAFVIVAPLLAELHFNAAQKLVASYRWTRAEEEFAKAIRIDPLNSQYQAGFADFLLRRSMYSDYGIPWIDLTIKFYSRALALNPRNAEYAMKLGQAQLVYGLRLLGQGKAEEDYKGIIMEALDNFKISAKNDPNGFTVSYSIGYGALSVWRFLNPEEKEFALAKLKNCLKILPWYSVYIYPKLWQYAKDFRLLERITPDNLQSCQDLYDFMVNINQWQFRREVVHKLNVYKQKEAPKVFERERQERLKRSQAIKKSYMDDGRITQITQIVPKESWQCRTDDGREVVTNGLLYGNGTVYAAVYLKAGKATVSIDAKKLIVIDTADSANPKFYPYMIVKIDGEDIGETFVGNDEWREYNYSATTEGGLKILSVSFVNDIYIPQEGEDRNLYVGDARITYK